MPIYMDRHDVSEEVTAEHVAQLHQEDLKIEHEFNCKGLTYWFDGNRKTAFCLVEAPNKEAIQKMHNQAHGILPHKIIEVDENLVESFLGRIEDPKNKSDNIINIIDDPAFRIIMVIESNNHLSRLEANQFGLFAQKFHNSVSKSIKKFKGNIVKSDNNNYLVSFKSVSNAVVCSLKILYNIKYTTPKFDLAYRKVNIALSSGIPVTENENIFEDAIVLATRMCEVVRNKLVISKEVKELYQNENRNVIIDSKLIKVLNFKEEKFLTQLMDSIKKTWNKPDFKVSYLSKQLGYSTSQMYRKLKSLTGKSPNNFIREFKLQKALDLLHKQHGNISEIAYETGFNSPAYFSKCFMKKFGILPSIYAKHNVANS
jgi:AraC-like DNA-binding protein